MYKLQALDNVTIGKVEISLTTAIYRNWTESVSVERIVESGGCCRCSYRL